MTAAPTIIAAGPVRSRSRPAKLSNPLDHVFLEATRQAGHAGTSDLNGYRQEGFGTVDRTVHKGRRWSAADAYLRPALGRPNLDLVMTALTRQIVFDGKRAIGVDYSWNGERVDVRAEREVILCAGTINTPHLLMHSGIGDADHLKQHGIHPVQHLPRCRLQSAGPSGLLPPGEVQTAGELLSGHDPCGAGSQSACAGYSQKTVCVRTNLMEAGGYIRTRPDTEHPNIQCTFMAVAADYSGARTHRGHGYQAFFDLMRPASRGQVRLNSADPRTPPSILFNYLSEEIDRRDVVDGFRATRNILAQEAFVPYDGGEFNPGPGVQTDAENPGPGPGPPAKPNITRRVPAKMGTGEDAVVDSALRVHRIDDLRIVDASIMPAVVSANTNAAVIMIAEKAGGYHRRQTGAPTQLRTCLPGHGGARQPNQIFTK